LDSRAHQLLITHSNGWHAISSPEIFSRHSGTCIIIGDRTNPGKPYPIKLGDCFRLGSVGVVVSEVKIEKGVEQRLESKKLQYLREEALAFEGDQDEAALAAEEGEEADKKLKKEKSCSGIDDRTERDTAAAPFFCYMCYETHDTPEDHLVAPCDCKGDTRYLHVQCLQKWYQSSVCGSRALVIRTTGNGAPACKICGAAYKTVFRNNGVKTSLLEVEHPGPYISLVVVTRHDTSPGLFNTKFRLNFGPGYRIGGEPNQLQDDPDLSPSELTIGRSSVCNMVLDYRTVSTMHAKLSYRNGQFFVQDARSSNGTMVYLQGPLPLQPNQPIRLRMGRSTLAIQVRKTLSASLKGTLQRAPAGIPCTASLDRLQDIMALAPPFVPKSIRSADPGGTADYAMGDRLSSVSHGSSNPMPIQSFRLHAQANAAIDLDDNSIVERRDTSNQSPPVMSAGSALLMSNGIDGALILGEPRRVSSRPGSAAAPTSARNEEKTGESAGAVVPPLGSFARSASHRDGDGSPAHETEVARLSARSEERRHSKSKPRRASRSPRRTSSPRFDTDANADSPLANDAETSSQQPKSSRKSQSPRRESNGFPAMAGQESAAPAPSASAGGMLSSCGESSGKTDAEEKEAV
jgi:predicted component of type VI protein secretion system